MSIRRRPGGVSVIRYGVLWNPDIFESGPFVDREVQCFKLVLTTRA